MLNVQYIVVCVPLVVRDMSNAENLLTFPLVTDEAFIYLHRNLFRTIFFGWKPKNISSKFQMDRHCRWPCSMKCAKQREECMTFIA